MSLPIIKKNFTITTEVTANSANKVLTATAVATVEGNTTPYNLLLVKEPYSKGTHHCLSKFFKDIFELNGTLYVHNDFEYISLLNDNSVPVHEIKGLYQNNVRIDTMEDMEEYINYLLYLIKHIEVMYSEYTSVTVTKKYNNADLDDTIIKIPTEYRRYGKDN